MGDWQVYWLFLQQGIASGLVTGSIYALLAIAIVIIFKTTDAPNFAAGEIFMAGAYIALYLVIFSQIAYVIAVPVTLGVTFILSALFYRVVLRRIGVSPAVAVNVVIATLGLSFVLKGIVRNTGFGDVPRSFPAVFGADTIQIGDAVLTMQDVAVFALALLAMVIFFVFFNYTRTGRAMRAVGMNPRAAALVGIDLHRTRMLIWGLSGLLSALAAILIAPKILMTADMGIVVILGFAAAIVGGFTSLPGAVVGGLIIGIVENLVGLFVSTRAIVVAPFIVIMLVLAVRPQGLFGGPTVIKKV
ncbi:MAG TPA: branched-chain amino acid ABC transporter permease [Alphaproteobacteria bacterium]